MRLMSLPWFPLAQLPTPLMPARNLSAALGGPEILIKRDDLTGLAMGGNKTRKLEYLIADARLQDATVVITMGAAQSNHCRQTAAAACIAGMKSVLVVNDESAEPDVQGNLLLDKMLGADVRVVQDKASRKPMMEQVADELRKAGEVPYIIPGGGSNPIGASSYVAATYEIASQLIDQGRTASRLYTTSSASGGTHAGLALGAKLAGVPYDVIGASIEGRSDDVRDIILPLANDTAEFLGVDLRLNADDVVIDDDYTGPAYGVATDECLEAMRLCARTEAIFLDPVYTGKTMAALIGHIRSGQISSDETVIFLHSGGTPALFAQRDVVVAGMQESAASR